MQFKSLLLSAVVVLALAQTTLANIYSQLQFMKIESPKDNQDVRAGEDLTITYVMQPLIDGIYISSFKEVDDLYFIIEQTSPGRALGLDINFHRRTGDQKQQQLSYIHRHW